MQSLKSDLERTEAELQRVRDEGEARRHLVDILHEVMGNHPTEEILHLLARRLARALRLSHASVIIAQPGDRTGIVATAFEQPHLHDLAIALDEHPEVVRALETRAPVLIADLQQSSLNGAIRETFPRDGGHAIVRSVMALPFSVDELQMGVFLLRRTVDEPCFDASDVEFASTVVRSGVTAIQRARAVEAAQADNDRLEALLQTDPLTQLVNRRALKTRLLAEMERVRRYDAPLAMLLLDLDHFKKINDTYGHLVGDEVLTGVGSLLQRTARSIDTVARYGGEEFVVVLPETSWQGAVAFAERIRDKLASHRFQIAGTQQIQVTASIGVATYPWPQLESAEDLFRAADSALYRAKGRGRNLVCS